MVTAAELEAKIRENNEETFIRFIKTHHMDLEAYIEIEPGLRFTPALMAAGYNADNVIIALARLGVNLKKRIEVAPRLGYTPALMAVEQNADQVIAALARLGVDLRERIEVRPGLWRTPALMAAQCNADKVIAALARLGVDLRERIEVRPGLWRTPALMAVEHNADQVMAALVLAGVPINEAIEVRTGSLRDTLRLFLDASFPSVNSPTTLARSRILGLILGRRNPDDFKSTPSPWFRPPYRQSIVRHQQRLLAATVTVGQLQVPGGTVIPFEIIQVIARLSAMSGLTLPRELDAEMVKRLFAELCGRVYDDRIEKIIGIIASYAIERLTWLLPANQAISLLDPRLRCAKRTELKTYLRTIGDSLASGPLAREGALSLQTMSSHDRRNCAYQLAKMSLPWRPGEKRLNEPLPRLSSDDRDYLYPTQAVTKDASLKKIAMQTVRTCLPSCLSAPSKTTLARNKFLQPRLLDDRAQMLVALWHEINGARTDNDFSVVCQAAKPELMKCNFSLFDVSTILRHHFHRLQHSYPVRYRWRHLITHTVPVGSPFDAITNDDL